MLADAAAAALLAGVALPPVLADTAAAAVLATVAPPPVLADTGAAALLAIPALPPVLALLVASHFTFAQPVGRRLTNLEQVLPRDALLHEVLRARRANWQMAPCWRSRAA